MTKTKVLNGHHQKFSTPDSLTLSSEQEGDTEISRQCI